MGDAGQALFIAGMSIALGGAMLALVPRLIGPGLFTCDTDGNCVADKASIVMGSVGAGIATVGIPLWSAGEKRKSAFMQHPISLSLTGSSRAPVSAGAQLTVRF